MTTALIVLAIVAVGYWSPRRSRQVAPIPESPRSRRLPPRLLAVALALVACGGGDGVLEPRWEHAAIETRTIELINAHRATAGLAPLTALDVITQQARAHSVDMASGEVAFGHAGFQARLDAIRVTIAFSAAGENVAWNEAADPAALAVTSWLNSPGHRQNIEGDYDATGVGVARTAAGRTYLTQIFIRRN